MFRCNSGSYIANFTFAGIKASGTRGGNSYDNDAVYGLPTQQGWVASFYPGSIIRKSPYIQNCTNFADSAIDNSNFNPNNFSGTGGDLTSGPTGGGVLVDGSVPATSSPLRSFVVDRFTQITLDGPGCLVTNNGYAQLVSFFGTFCHYHAKALNGGQINLSNCTTDFGRYGLIADGKSTSPIFTATTTASSAVGALTVSIGAPVASGSWYGSSTRPQDSMLVQIGSNIYPILSSTVNGSGWTFTVLNPNPTKFSENLGLSAAVANGASVSFFQRSFVTTGGHTFEYVGSGTDYRALPENGGVADGTKQAISRNNAKVWQTSTDHTGAFKVGDTFKVDQRSGTVEISLDAFRPEMVNDLSPQLGGDLDVNGFNITGTVKLNGIRYPSTDGANNHILTTNGTGTLSFQPIGNITGAGLQNVVDDTTPELGGDFDVRTFSIVSTANRNININPNGTGKVVLDGLSYPAADGTTGQYLRTDGSGNLSFATVDIPVIDQTYVETPQTITVNKVIAANTNAALVGPTVTIGTGVTMTISTGSSLKFL
jgi:hypothetical protein